MARRGGPSKHQMQGLEFDRYGGEMPTFLKRLTGETPEGRAEKRRLEMPDGSDSEPEETGATVVVLKEGDLTAEEAALLREGRTLEKKNTSDVQQDAKDQHDDDDDDGSIKFRKPKKHKTLSGEGSGKASKNEAKPKSSKKDVKAVNNKSLLSFDDEEN